MAKQNTPQAIGRGFWDMVQLDPTDAPRVSPSGQFREPERLLVLAVLEDAVCLLKEYRESTSHQRALVIEARQWVESNAMYPFSFAWCCQHAGFDPDWLRRGIERMAPAVDSRRPLVAH
jgi:hypothetical protein